MSEACQSRDIGGECAFAEILRALVARSPGARAAVLVDSEGETVDYAGEADAFELRILAAHMTIARTNLVASNVRFFSCLPSGCPSSRACCPMAINSYCHANEGCCFLHCGPSPRALARSQEEAAWSWEEEPFRRAKRPRMGCDQVAQDADGRPLRSMRAGLQAERVCWHDVQVLGLDLTLPGGERGFRARLGPGTKMHDRPRKQWCMVRGRTAVTRPTLPLAVDAHRRATGKSEFAGDLHAKPQPIWRRFTQSEAIAVAPENIVLTLRCGSVDSASPTATGFR